MKKALTILLVLIITLVATLNISISETQYPLKINQRGMSITLNRSAGQTIVLTPKIDQITGWQIISGGVEIVNNQFTMPANAVEITAQYQVTSYEITVTQGANGTITPGTTSVTQGSNQVFTITPSEGYLIEDVKLDEQSILDQLQGSGAQKTYTLNNIQANHTISATYIPIVYTITTKADQGAIIEGVYTNHKCSICGGYDHECEVVNIFITTQNAEVTE